MKHGNDFQNLVGRIKKVEKRRNKEKKVENKRK
jgi:hypothetical protein